jgi:hypothetical protein
MSKKMRLGLGLVIGLLAMAFVALPAIASAAPELTTSKGATVPVGTTVSATSTNATSVLTGVGTLVCNHVEIHGIVEENSGTSVKIGMDKESDTAKECHLNKEPAEVAVKPTLTTISLTVASKTASFDFTALGGAISETTSGTGATVTYTGPKATVIHVAGPLDGTASGTFTADFTLLGGITLD